MSAAYDEAIDWLQSLSGNDPDMERIISGLTTDIQTLTDEAKWAKDGLKYIARVTPQSGQHYEKYARKVLEENGVTWLDLKPRWSDEE